MKITQAEVKHVARLARLTLSQDEVEQYTPQLDAILVAFQRLAEVSTNDALAFAAAQGQSELPLREDEVVTPLSRQQVLQNAPTSEQGGFFVPKIVEK